MVNQQIKMELLRHQMPPFHLLILPKLTKHLNSMLTVSRLPYLRIKLMILQFLQAKKIWSSAANSSRKKSSRRLWKKSEKIHRSWLLLKTGNRLKKEVLDPSEIPESSLNSKSYHHNCNQIKMDLPLLNFKSMKTSRNLENLQEKTIVKLWPLLKIWLQSWDL